ncbi:MAG: anaerobic sulfatase maturase [Candidatus Atribacteria bacterium]|nr:anaerobic sulfatase maturase [Candidatus Atribacteria bacterium]
MAKPIGAICNLNCSYCYYLSKKELIGSNKRITDDILEEYVKQYINAQDGQEIVFTWQGGEPTLLGLDFFQKVVELERKFCPPEKKIENDLQTNGVLLDDEWCKYLKKNRFLVGLSIDGPQPLHDCYRVDLAYQPTWERVVRAVKLLQKYEIPFNTLTVIHRQNARRPLDVYRFLRREIGSTRIQFIPLVEPKVYTSIAPQHWDEDSQPLLGSLAARPGNPHSVVTDCSVDPDDYGTFLCKVFDEWYRRDIGKAFVFFFECALGQWLGMEASLCIFAQTCGQALALESDGSVFSCDHYVYPEYRLGHIKQGLSSLVYSARQADFGYYKQKSLPEYCRKCPYLFACRGECPKNRFLRTPSGEMGLNYLCNGLRKYFAHIDPFMQSLAKEIKGASLFTAP